MEHDEQIKRRRDAIRRAVGNQRLEGLHVPSELLVELDKYALGQMTLEEIRAGILKRFQAKKAKDQEAD